MARYIDADKELVEMKFAWYPQDMDTTNAVGMYESFLKNAPAEDVAPVVHAHKVRVHSQGGGTHWVVCSHCEKPIDWQDAYCKHCGATMDEEVS